MSWIAAKRILYPHYEEGSWQVAQGKIQVHDEPVLGDDDSKVRKGMGNTIWVIHGVQMGIWD